MSPVPRWAIALIALLLAAAAIMVFMVWSSWQTAATARTEARLSTNQTGAALESGQDAVATAGETHATEVRIDVVTRENDHVINSAPGAATAVDPAAHSAGLASVCRRAANRGKPECVQPADPE